MGTKWHIALYAEDASAANTALKLAWKEIREIDQCLSNYSADSELNQFCKAAPQENFTLVSEHLASVLRAASDISRKSDGYFDVTIGPLANLWRRARATHRMPKPHRLQVARRNVGWQFIEFGKDFRQVRITRPDVKIDLGGIAKGYAVDRAIAILKSHGISSALVNGGGDLRAFGRTPEAEGWIVEVAGIEKDAPRRSFLLSNAALATSGDAWQYIEVDGKRYSHLIDPKTGVGATRRMSVSVYAPTCMHADALASALSVMPVASGLSWMQREAGAEAFIAAINEEGELSIRKTPRFPIAAQNLGQ